MPRLMAMCGTVQRPRIGSGVAQAITLARYSMPTRLMLRVIITIVAIFSEWKLLGRSPQTKCDLLFTLEPGLCDDHNPSLQKTLHGSQNTLAVHQRNFAWQPKPRKTSFRDFKGL